jgi:hypothetical protein
MERLDCEQSAKAERPTKWAPEARRDNLKQSLGPLTCKIEMMGIDNQGRAGDDKGAENGSSLPL